MARLAERVLVGLITVGGAGLVPRLRGTSGTAAACLLLLLLIWLDLAGLWVRLGVAVLATVLALALAPWAMRRYGKKDPQCFVLDELAGYFLGVCGCGLGVLWWEALVAFGLFRIFDGFKPPPVRRLEGLGRGVGITADDLMAGLYTALCMAGVGAILG